MSTRYTMIFVFVLTAVVAVSLAGFRELTKEVAEQNEDIFNKRAVLLAIEGHLSEAKSVDDLSDEQVLEVFSKMETHVLDMEGNEVEGKKAADIEMKKERKKDKEDRLLPFFIYDNGTEKFYILSVYGKGLWDDIWGCVALKEDLNTVAGVAFDHKGETPGLGGEITDNPSFRKSFNEKQIFKDGKFVSVEVLKRVNDAKHQVDGISGATITGVGVSDMLMEGLGNYLPYLEKIKQK